MIKKLATLAFFAALAVASAFAQSPPNPPFTFGFVPTAGQWNSFFQQKQDFLNFTPLNPANVTATSPITSNIVSGLVTIACPTCAITTTGVTRQVITSDLTLFVRTDGSDLTCNGTVNVSAASAPNCAFASVNFAAGIISQNYDLGCHNATISINAGSYGTGNKLGAYVGRCNQNNHTGPVIITGDCNNPNNVVINPSGSDGFLASETGGFEWMLQCMKINPTGGAAVIADANSWMVIGQKVTTAVDASQVHYKAVFNGIVEFFTALPNDPVINSGGVAYLFGDNGGIFIYPGAQTPSVSGGPFTFSGAFITLSRSSTINASLATMPASNINGSRFSFDSTVSYAIGNVDPNVFFSGNAPGQVTPTFNIGQNMVVTRAVNFNSANTDTQIAVPVPPGFTRYQVLGLFISGASASLSTATCGLFTQSGGGGFAIVTGGTAITVTATGEGSNNNFQSFTIQLQNTATFATNPLFFRVGTAQGSAATGVVTLIYRPMS